MAVEVIQHVEIGAGGAASLTFTSIPQNFTHLYVKFSGRMTRAGNSGSIFSMRINGDSSTICNYRLLLGNAAYTGTSASFLPAGYINGPTSTAGLFSNHSIHIPNYAGSLVKNVTAESTSPDNSTSQLVCVSAGLYNSTSPVTSLYFAELNGPSDLVEHTTATLYGITAGSDGTTTVS